jgi:hypothetical protein
MKAQSIVRPPVMTSKDREFENLLRRAAELLNRRSSDRGPKSNSQEHKAAALISQTRPPIFVGADPKDEA